MSPGTPSLPSTKQRLKGLAAITCKDDTRGLIESWQIAYADGDCSRPFSSLRFIKFPVPSGKMQRYAM